MSDLAARLRAAIDALGEGETYAERNLSNLAGEAADALDREPTDEAVTREMCGYRFGSVGFQSCLDDVINVREAERRAVNAAERAKEGR